MTPAEKAKELVSIYSDFEFNPLLDNKKLAKDCASLCVDEVIKSLTDYGTHQSDELQNMDRTLDYWKQVENEINKL